MPLPPLPLLVVELNPPWLHVRQRRTVGRRYDDDDGLDDDHLDSIAVATAVYRSTPKRNAAAWRPRDVGFETEPSVQTVHDPNTRKHADQWYGTNTDTDTDTDTGEAKGAGQYSTRESRDEEDASF